MYDREYTPKIINSLKPGEVFVFGSNIHGQHAGGAAKDAYEKFGAEWGVGEGLTGQSYALPTMEGGVDYVAGKVEKFIECARLHPELKFYVTPVGCGKAGFRIEEIGPLFAEAVELENVILPKDFVLQISYMDPVANNVVKPFSAGQFFDILGLDSSNGKRDAFIAEAEQRAKDRQTVTDDEKRFCDIILKYNRPGTVELLEWLKLMDFFVAPASVNYHNNFKGGLVKHSLEVYDCAIKEREKMIEQQPEVEENLPLEQVAISALLHDVCKHDEYKVDLQGKPHHLHKPTFPIGGHGDKSVILVLDTGFQLYAGEILAIKWHMGSQHLTDRKEIALCQQALEEVPLCKLICKADYDATH